jgi:hypothetical protein
MSDTSGEELPPVVAALEGNDESFLAMLERDVAAAEEFSAELRAALSAATDSTGIGNESGAGAAVAASMDAGFAEVEAAAAETSAVVVEEFDQAAAAVAAAGAEAGDAYGQAMQTGVEASVAQVSELLAAGLDEEAQAIMDQLPSVVEGPATAAGEQIGAALGRGVDTGFADAAEAVAASSEAVGQQAGAALADGASAGVSTLADRMRAGYDNVLASWTAGDQAFVAAQLNTFADYYAGLAALGDQSAVAQLEALKGLGAATEGVLAQVAATAQQTAQAVSDSAFLQGDALQAEIAAYEAAYGSAGTAAGAAFDSSLMAALESGQAGISDAALAGFASLLPEASTSGEQAGAEFGITFSDGVRASMMTTSVSSIVGDEFTAAASSMAPVAAEAGTAIGDEFSLALQSSIRLAMSTAGSAGGMDLGFSVLATDVEAAGTALGDDFAIAYSKSAQRGLAASTDTAKFIAGGLPSALDETAAAADKATSSMGLMANMMYGPLGYAAFSALYFLPQIGSLFSSNAVSASAFTAAVTQDSNAIGDNTAATIQTSLAKSNLSGISQQLGLSQAQLIEYAAGEANVQQQVAAAYEAKTAALQQSEQAQGRVTAGRSGANATDPNAVSLSQLQAQKTALDAVTTAVQQAVAQDQAQSDALLAAEQTTQIYTASVNALGSAQLLQVEQTQMSNQATAQYSDRVLAAMQTDQYFAAAVGAAGAKMLQGVETTRENNTAIVQYGDAVMGAYRDTATFNAALDASYVSMQISAQTSAQTSVGLLNLGDSQASLNGRLVMSEDAYTQATQGASAYGTALTALNGDTATLLGAEATFTTSLNSLTTSIKTNGDSLDVNTTKGAANTQAVLAIAHAADQAAIAVFQNEVNTVGSTKAYQDANNVLEQEKVKFENQAIAAGMSKDKVKQLADQLFQLPPAVDIPINANTQPAQDSVAALLASIDYSTAYVNVGTKMSSPQLKAAGGPVEAGQIYHVNEAGAEGYFVPPADGYIVPHDAMAALGSGGGVGPAWGASGGAPSGGGGAAPQVTVHVYLDGREISAQQRAEAQGYANHNGFTGFETTASRISR